MLYAILIVAILWLLHRENKVSRDAQSLARFLGAYIDHANPKSKPSEKVAETKRLLDTMDWKSSNKIFERIGRVLAIPVRYDGQHIITVESEQEILSALYRK